MKKRVVIIGGGFAGSHIAKKLEKKFDVTLVDTKNYFEFTPGILRTVVKPKHMQLITALHNSYLKKAKIVVGEVSEASREFIKVSRRKIKFDYLVVSSGSTYNAPFKEQKVVIAARAKHLQENYSKLCKAKKVLIIGGGLVGIEMAGEIFWRYSGEKEITIVHSRSRLIQRNSEKASKYAENFLKKRGVEIIYDDFVVDIKKTVCKTKKGLKLKADIIFLCTGIEPNYKFMKKYFLNRLSNDGFVKVNDYLQLQNEKNIFIAGDLADKKEEKTAQNAERQGKIIAKNICALESGNKLLKYESKRTPLVISLGKYDGIYSGEKYVFGGIIPGLMKTIIEKFEMLKKQL